MKLLMLIVAFILAAAQAQAYPVDSIYTVAMQWRDDNAAAVELKQFEGKNIVLVMVYTSCRSVCPLIVKKLKEIEKERIAKKLAAEFVLVSLDPERDTPEALAAFRKREELNQPYWHLLVGSAADTRKLSNLLGASYQKNAGTGEIMHSNKITLLDGQGVVSYVLEGLNDPVAPLVDKLGS